MKDVACAGYVAGGNTRWFAQDDKGAFSMETAQDALQARLSFSHDDTDRYASMLAFPCYEGQFQSGQLDTVMSVTTRLLPWEVNNAGNHMSFPGGHDAYLAYAGALQLGQVHYGEDMKAAGSRLRRLKPCPLATPADRPPACVPSQRTRISSPRDRLTYAQATQPTCLARSLLTRALPSPVIRTQPAFLVRTASTTPSPRASCRSFRARASARPRSNPPPRPACRALTTHHPRSARSRSFGPDAIPGDARWRRGESVSLKTARDSMVSLEYAALPLKPAPCLATRPSADPSPLPCAGWPSTPRWRTRRVKRAAHGHPTPHRLRGLAAAGRTPKSDSVCERSVCVVCVHGARRPPQAYKNPSGGGKTFSSAC